MGAVCIFLVLHNMLPSYALIKQAALYKAAASGIYMEGIGGDRDEKRPNWLI